LKDNVLLIQDQIKWSIMTARHSAADNESRRPWVSYGPISTT